MLRVAVYWNVRLGWRTHYLSNSPGPTTGTLSDEMASKRSEDEYGENVNRAIVDTGVKMGKAFPKDRTNMYIDKVAVKQMQRKFELDFFRIVIITKYVCFKYFLKS